ncbi:hypothetical protein ACFWTE_09775 [Nocardiopsis sp. NPDC058631]|uniref:hypothetical protein n=1 Tax=Nocardiopsis sp. NPDC058631 TaxID=3346566 RepID=UPI003646EF80
MGALFEEQSARYGSALPGLLYFVLPVLCAAAAALVRRTRPLWLTSVALVLPLGFANPVPAMVALYSYASHPGRALYPCAPGAAARDGIWAVRGGRHEPAAPAGRRVLFSPASAPGPTGGRRGS